MPLFDFKCRECDKAKPDVILRVQEVGHEEFYPKCEEHGVMEKLIGNPGRAILKGRGFHANDYHAPTRG